MKAIHAGVLAMLTTVAFVPVANGETAACSPSTLLAQELPGGYYVSSFRREIWQEENGFAGLQIRAYTCSDGSIIPPDQCLAVDPFTGLNQQAICALAASDDTL